MAKSKNKFYAVARGRKTGVFTSWNDCQVQTKRFSGAVFKSFHSHELAQAFVDQQSSQSVSKKRNQLSMKNNLEDDVSSTRNLEDDLEQPSKLTENVEIPIKRQKIEPGGEVINLISGVVVRKLSIYLTFDGGSRGNPGISGAGAYIVAKDQHFPKDDDKSSVQKTENTSWMKIRYYCGNNKTNNVAEYTGMLVGLKEVKKFMKRFINNIIPPNSVDDAIVIAVSIKGDSLLVDRQIGGSYECRDKKLIPLYEKCIILIKEIRKMGNTDTNINVQLEHSHVYRHLNKEADALANEAMDNEKSWITSDFSEIAEV